MAKYYSVAVLPPNTGLTIAGDDIRVNLDAVTAVVEDDVQMVAARGKGNYLYLSGGGTLLLNKRYLLMVERDANARINPNVWSLFTGRADGAAEWEKPELVVRELFEELLIYMDDKLANPRCEAHQAVIDAVYAKLPKTNATLTLTPVPLPEKTLHVAPSGHTTKGHVVMGAQGDMHLLFVLGAEVDLDTLTAEDGEHGTGGIKRNIAALDLHTMHMLPISSPPPLRKWLDASPLSMSDHLRGLIETLRQV